MTFKLISLNFDILKSTFIQIQIWILSYSGIELHFEWNS